MVGAFSSAVVAVVAVAVASVLLTAAVVLLVMIAAPEEAGRKRRGMGVEGASWRGKRRMIGRPTRARRYVENGAVRDVGVCGCGC